PILVGEIVYNLRAALDYLIYQLAYLDTGKVQKGTKFPIEDHINSWKTYIIPRKSAGRRKWPLWLPLLTKGHQAEIEGLQPFRGCKWTKTLRELSNPDKHADLIIIDAHAVARIWRNTSLETLTIPPMRDPAVNVQGKFSAIVAFKDA